MTEYEWGGLEKGDKIQPDFLPEQICGAVFEVIGYNNRSIRDGGGFHIVFNPRLLHLDGACTPERWSKLS